MPRRHVEVDPSTYPQGGARPLELNEDHSGLEHQGIEVVQEMPAKSEVDLENFMAEKVVIRVHKVKGAPPGEFIGPTVNGRPHYIPRGIPVTVARKYVEVLARSHEVTYDYSGDPTRAIMEGELPVPTSNPIHSFEVLRDSEEGHAWLEELYKQPQ